jgi:AraC-like DNA-binding protein
MRNVIEAKTYRLRNAPMLDSLPEQVHYADNGCEVSGTCLACPLPQCKFDNLLWYRAYRREGRDLELQEAHNAEKLSVFEIAQRFHISSRTVQRALRRLPNRLLVHVATAD